MVHSPDTGSAVRKREALIRKLERDLARFQRIPAAHREAECADEGESTCRAFLAELYGQKPSGAEMGNGDHNMLVPGSSKMRLEE